MKAFALIFLATIAWAEPASTTHLWAPVYPTWGVTTSYPTANVMRCVEWIPEVGITNATAIVFNVSSALGATGLCAAAIYTGDGTMLKASTLAQDCSGGGVVGNTSLTAFSLDEGTKYLICTCANVAAGGYLSTDITGNGINHLGDLMNSITPTIGLQAATACTAAVPPSSTGALSAVQTGGIYLLISTTTP